MPNEAQIIMEAIHGDKLKTAAQEFAESVPMIEDIVNHMKITLDCIYVQGSWNRKICAVTTKRNVGSNGIANNAKCLKQTK